jgi:hypothetical protein
MLRPEPTIEAYRKFARLRIDAVNHAVAGIREEKVATTCAGAAGTGRTPMTCLSNTSSI